MAGTKRSKLAAAMRVVNEEMVKIHLDALMFTTSLRLSNLLNSMCHAHPPPSVIRLGSEVITPRKKQRGDDQSCQPCSKK